MSGLTTALRLLTVAPLRSHEPLSRSDAVASVRWFPVVGALLGAIAALPVAAAARWASHATLLAAALAVGLLVAGTRGLHLDGLADTVDGLGSAAPADRALEIMRRPDIGPFGVASIVLVLVVDTAAVVATAEDVWRPVAAVAVAAATGRAAVVAAARRGIPAARSGGLGVYIAASQSAVAVMVAIAGVLAFGAGLAAAVDASVVGWPIAQAAALLATLLVERHAVRRLGGVTGDVFGALVEIATALTLSGIAFS